MTVYLQMMKNNPGQPEFAIMFSDNLKELTKFSNELDSTSVFSTDYSRLIVKGQGIKQALSIGAILTDEHGEQYHIAKTEWDGHRMAQIEALRETLRW